MDSWMAEPRLACLQADSRPSSAGGERSYSKRPSLSLSLAIPPSTQVGAALTLGPTYRLAACLTPQRDQHWVCSGSGHEHDRTQLTCAQPTTGDGSSQARRLAQGCS